MKFKIHTSNRLQKCYKVNLKKGTVCIFISPIFKLCRERSFLGGDKSQKLRESRNKTSLLFKKKQSKSNISTRIQLSRRFFKLTLKVLILIELWKISFLVDTPHRSEEFCLQWSFVPGATVKILLRWPGAPRSLQLSPLPPLVSCRNNVIFK